MVKKISVLAGIVVLMVACFFIGRNIGHEAGEKQGYEAGEKAGYEQGYDTCREETKVIKIADFEYGDTETFENGCYLKSYFKVEDATAVRKGSTNEYNLNAKISKNVMELYSDNSKKDLIMEIDFDYLTGTTSYEINMW